MSKRILYNLLVVFFLLISCKSDRPIDIKKITSISAESAVIQKEINEVNFYFENSGSMNGYLNGNDFLETMIRIIGNSEIENLNTFFVNTAAHKTENLLDKIEKNKIAVGNTGSSDHQFIFKTAIENAKNNNLSIVVTDGIYSVKGKKPSIVSVKIEQTFVKALNENTIETVVLKMASNFNGNYYSETCNPGSKSIEINQTRPYYIFLFGNNQVIKKALNEIVILNDLKGQEEQARFMITKDVNINYTVLTQGEEKQGSFKQTSKSWVVKEIGDAEKFSKRGVPLKDSYLQFGVAVDFSKRAIPESYLLNTSNYSVVNNTGYSIEEIKKVSDLDKTTKSYKWIDTQNKKGEFKYTHIIVVKAKEKLYGDLTLILNINFPEWIGDTGTNNDCDIKNDTTTTFAFDRLMTGVSKAYKKVGKRDDFFKINVKIKAN
ncbi:hypothetical protein K8354_04570 [Polaribacter litorisediminis]|uniref:hypothetical protein n=1 Tax=Polaribacter litorisediminis TaxID=1908341 RepID=UPI001CBEF8B3|nr:hypothetical protein [Polaribacter litorisediminis]UAM99104.1 hypothetical protein K8354_04570 [Polaribacter litorisediminis]